MPSTLNLAGLPPPAVLRSSLRSAALLSVVYSQEEHYRCFRFDPAFDGGVSLGTYDNGSGDHMHVVFGGEHVAIKGFDHESPVSPYARDGHSSWPGIFEDFPAESHALLSDPALMREDVTFCVWWSGSEWECGALEFLGGEDDGSSFLLPMAMMNAVAFVAWVKDYYECDADPSIVQSVFDGVPLDRAMIVALNPDRDAGAALAELAAM